MSFYQYQCRSRQLRCCGSGTWRAPLSLEPLARFVTGGAGARPDHSISRHSPNRGMSSIPGKFSKLACLIRECGFTVPASDCGRRMSDDCVKYLLGKARAKGDSLKGMAP